MSVLQLSVVRVWSSEQGVGRVRCPCWLIPQAVQVAVQPDRFPVTYKYALTSADGQLELEAGENRLISIPSQGKAPELLTQEDGYFRCALLGATYCLWRHMRLLSKVVMRSLGCCGQARLAALEGGWYRHACVCSAQQTQRGLWRVSGHQAACGPLPRLRLAVASRLLQRHVGMQLTA